LTSRAKPSSFNAVGKTFRDFARGLGPELDSTLAPIRSQITVRYWTLPVRPLGRMLVIQLTILARP
jgi:hypothetical protein